MGLVLSVFVHRANMGDRDGFKVLLRRAANKWINLLLIWVDGGYSGKDFASRVKQLFGCLVEVVKRCDDVSGFTVLPRRWVVERTFGWLGRYRRLSKDYEFHPKTSENMIYLGMIRLMLRRLSGRSYSTIGYVKPAIQLVPL